MTRLFLCVNALQRAAAFSTQNKGDSLCEERQRVLMPLNGRQPFLRNWNEFLPIIYIHVLMPSNGRQPFLLWIFLWCLLHCREVLMPLTGRQPFLHLPSQIGSMSGFARLFSDIYVKYFSMQCFLCLFLGF